ncbi:hypothetical protein [Acinetobacter beijerinckii]|uniref:Uncharacterized protein n=1 Tax=Acinetobacter beijerinckii ANC 3835 TaxID=1217649 RepID=N9FLM0_9GAMM|nr:hypothetical protein [Acinetobacter beijerinckii]ENW05749.1 hypothetical protein F934_01106 [Acinetobacter beijerinckii ANC 3835]
MKKLIIGFIVLALAALGYMYKANKDKQIEKQRLQNVELIKSKTQRLKEVDIEKLAVSGKLDTVDQKFYSEIATKWSDGLSLAGSTPRLALSTPVQNLQAIKREVENKQPKTDCEAVMKTNLLYAYDYTIKSILNFMQDSESASKEYMNEGMVYMDNAIFLIDYCKTNKTSK